MCFKCNIVTIYVAYKFVIVLEGHFVLLKQFLSILSPTSIQQLMAAVLAQVNMVNTVDHVI
jgi:hypothetical protein